MSEKQPSEDYARKLYEIEKRKQESSAEAYGLFMGAIKVVALIFGGILLLVLVLALFKFVF